MNKEILKFIQEDEKEALEELKDCPMNSYAHGFEMGRIEALKCIQLFIELSSDPE